MKAGIIGATGYAGAELVRLLAGHPNINDLALSSISFEGEKIEDVYPHFQKRISSALVKADEAIDGADVVFSALPHGVGGQFAKVCIERGVPFIDLSADFRFGEDEATYSAWYEKPYTCPEIYQYSIYGLPELNRSRIRKLAASNKVIIGNPGCYPTGASLGAFPALAKALVAASSVVIVDSASGISGGGREPSRSFHYPECADSVAPYKVGAHRHTPEIAHNFAAMTERKDRPAQKLIFTPHLVPMNRGILSTIYIPLDPAWQVPQPGTAAVRPPSELIQKQTAALHEVYVQFYRDEPFVRVLPIGVTAATNRVRQSNYCDISVHMDHTGSTLIVVSAIDNMVKGAAGQAIQNMNVIFGFEEHTGLEMIPAVF